MFNVIFKIFKTFSLIIFFIITYVSFSYGNSPDLIKDLLNTKNHNKFVEILEGNPLFLSLLNNTVPATLYAPTDAAFDVMPKKFTDDLSKKEMKFTTKLILSHIFNGNSLSNKQNSDGMVLTLDGSIYFTYEVGDLYVKDIVTQGPSFVSGTYTIVPVDCVMFLQPSSNDPRLDKNIQEKFKFTTCCLQTDEELNEFYKGL